ncbi:MAG TPA: SRPBCC family protein [Actinomycetaceae bacterium]|nr:SRPBCC family protein [Actinomycetaceae bacterium]
MRSRHISTVVSADPAAVYAFAADPDNLPRWAAGLARSEVSRDGDVLRASSPMGEVTVRFAPANDLGVLDHDVTLPTGATVTNPLRVLAHPDGAEIVFTLRQLKLSDEEFERDAAMVEADLARLKAIVERQNASTGLRPPKPER